MKKCIIVIAFIFLSLLVGCSVNAHDETKKADIQEDAVSSEKLVIYMNASPHVFRTFDEEGEQLDTVVYPSRHVIGTMLSAGDVNSPNANIFEKALSEYEKGKNIEIEVHYLEETYTTGEYDILQEIIFIDLLLS